MYVYGKIIYQSVLEMKNANIDVLYKTRPTREKYFSMISKPEILNRVLQTSAFVHITLKLKLTDTEMYLLQIENVYFVLQAL
jgi:hypothetical protein